MLKIKINNSQFDIPKGFSVLQACSFVNIYIPKFCFHERLLVSGNCRICLVEVLGTSKPAISCVTTISEGIEIYTDSPSVRKSRESALEFLLINHPLDCPVCDQGSECDLQDQSIAYGSSMSRFFNYKKRSLSAKNWGPLIGTVINRCIHCTRCVRFLKDTVGSKSLGILGRGKEAEISLFKTSQPLNIYMGNLVDLCPVSFLKN